MAERILVIEDNKINSRLMQKILENRGLEVIVLGSAEKALSQLHRIAPDLILLDLQLPGMSGYDFVKNMHRQNGSRQIPVVAVSANVRQTDKDRAKEAGCLGFIEKPVNTRTVVDEILSYLEEVT